MARNFSSDFLSAGDVTYLDGITFSWMCWVFLDTFSADQILWEKNTSNFNNGISVFADNVGPNANKVWEIFVDTGGSVARIQSAVADTAEAGRWFHLGGWFEAGNSTGLSLLIDGVHSNGSPATMVGINALNDTIDPLFIGQHNNSGDRRYLDGLAANLTFWAGRLNVADFAAAARGVPHQLIRRNDIIRYFPIGWASPDPDISGSGDTLTVSGTVISDNPPVGPVFFDTFENVITVAAGATTRRYRLPLMGVG